LNNPVLLIFTDWFAPGYKAGGPIKSVVNLVNAIESQIDICIVTSDCDYEEKMPYPDITANQWVPYGRQSRVFYVSPEYLTFKNTRRIIKDIQPDIVYLNSMWSVRFTLIPLWILRNQPDVKLVLAPRGMLQKGALSFKSTKKKVFLFVLNLTKLTKNVIFHATDKQESLDIQKNCQAKDICVIGNVVNNEILPVLKQKKTKHKLNLVFVSRISPKKNLLFVLDILEKVSKETEIVIDIFGPEEDEAYSQKCKLLANKLPQNIITNFRGSIINSEVPAVIQKSHFFILPTLGENFGHAIYESFAAGRPVIISDKTPWRDLESKSAGFDISFEDTKAWVETIQKCADMDQSEFDTWCFHAYNLAKNYSDNNQLKEKYIQLFS